MTNWEVDMINTEEPFDRKKVLINTQTIAEALDLAEQSHKPYYARSARFHCSDLSKEFGYGYGPVEAQAV